MTTEELTREWTALMERRIALLDGVLQLRLQLDEARARASRFGERADGRWYHETMRELRSREARIATLQLRIQVVDRIRQERLRAQKREHDAAHREFHAARDRTHDRAFVRVAKRLLPAATYLEIWRQAEAEVGHVPGQPDGMADPGHAPADVPLGRAGGAI
jgi:hypothetical protein